MSFGLKKFEIDYIVDVIGKFEEIEKAVVFGSRAKGNYKSESDIDVAIYGERVNFDTVSALHSLLEEQGPLPYMYDVVDYAHIKSEALKEHIDRVGELLYVKKEES